jgi:AbrB family looped-hinge helix DNA binding protein
MKVRCVQITKAPQEVDAMELIKARRNFQLTIPRALREKLGLAVGDYVQADIEDERIVIRTVEVARAGQADRPSPSKERQAAYAILDEISRKMADEDPEVIHKTIEEAVREAGKQ